MEPPRVLRRGPGPAPPRRRRASVGSSFPGAAGRPANFVFNLKTKATQICMPISFRIHPQRNGSSPLGQELHFLAPSKGQENLFEMLRPAFEILRAAGADNANAFKA